MNGDWWITLALGAVCGALIVGTWLRAMQAPREGEAYIRGVQDARDGLAPRRPVDHPARRADRGITDVQAALGGLLCAVVVLWLAGGVW